MIFKAMIYSRNLIARMFQKGFIDLPLEVAVEVISKMSDEQICNDFNMEVFRKGYFIFK